MLNKISCKFTAACMALSVLLCGCGAGRREDVILIGGSGADGLPVQQALGNQEPAGAPVPQPSGNPQSSGAPVQQLSVNQESASPQAAEPPMMRVYVCGAVACPGVVEIPHGSRIEDALSAAGGFLPEALEGAVNLADWARDGQMLYFPGEGEEAARKPAQEEQPYGNGQDGLVDINAAGAALLCTLPGIGESRAADIIAYREAHGGFTCREDIMKVPGIKAGVYEKICDKITVK